MNSGRGYAASVSREVVDAHYVEQDAMQFVFSVGDPTKRMLVDEPSDVV